MSEESIQSIPFIRSQERRTADLSRGIKHGNIERRTLGINHIPLFHNIDETTVSEALTDSAVLIFPAGASLLKLGETNQNVYILLSGEVVAQLDGNINQNTAIAISAGEYIGELSAIDGKPASALVVALSEVRVLKLTRDVFWYKLMLLPGIARNFMISLTDRMRRSSEMTLKIQRKQLELIHIRKELDVARQLQASMLPPQRPLFTERQDIEVCGFMEPASDIGGDLFDAFFVDEHHLFFCIGDVSGHGIAAAMFMARTIGLLRILAMYNKQPDKLLNMLNDQLCIGNDSSIFVTLICGFLDVRNGKLRYSNGGHCAPILSTGGDARPIAIPKGALLGVFPDINYVSMAYDLNPGELLFCYTDGLTEAQNHSGEEFSEERCLEILEQVDSASLPSLLETLRLKVVDFTDADIFYDDCTMLAIRRPL